MFVTLSFRNYAQLIREAENLEPGTTDAEISVRLDHYSQRIWDHMFNLGIKMIGLVERTPDVAAFQVSLAGIGHDYATGGFNFEKLREALNWIRPVAVTLQESDIEEICTGPVATAMVDSFPAYSDTLQRISVGQIQPAIEAACLKFAWGNRIEVGATLGENPELDAQMRYEEDTAQLERAGVRNPTEQWEAQQAYNQAEIDAYAAREQARLDRIVNGG
jgi:hypothetical protein